MYDAHVPHQFLSKQVHEYFGMTQSDVMDYLNGYIIECQSNVPCSTYKSDLITHYLNRRERPL